MCDRRIIGRSDTRRAMVTPEDITRAEALAMQYDGSVMPGASIAGLVVLDWMGQDGYECSVAADTVHAALSALHHELSAYEANDVSGI